MPDIHLFQYPFKLVMVTCMKLSKSKQVIVTYIKNSFNDMKGSWMDVCRGRVSFFKNVALQRFICYGPIHIQRALNGRYGFKKKNIKLERGHVRGLEDIGLER